MRRLTKYERETIVNFNEEEEVAYIFTYRKDWQRKLESMGYKPDFENIHKGRGYRVPKSLVIKPPRKNKRLSQKQKENLHQRLGKKSILSEK